MPRILFVAGFDPQTRAKDLAYEFERYGPLVRCDVPAPRNPNATHKPYAFVEFQNPRDAEDAYYEMHNRYFEGHRLGIQWAKNPPSAIWRSGEQRPPRRDPPRHRDRSRSPRRRDDRDRGDRDRGRDYDREPRRPRSRSPDRRRPRTPSPPRDARRDDRARTPPPPTSAEPARAQTPPYDR
ncbi:hypothetical protein DL96DRAFT_1616116 [Flagelloscypha sp. PMI_526]|nr:hypothetical protein DL96DRAFT_1616116 [Flagelloscypha sp. PMI_526]